jgi:hypothetical protein
MQQTVHRTYNIHNKPADENGNSRKGNRYVAWQVRQDGAVVNLRSLVTACLCGPDTGAKIAGNAPLLAAQCPARRLARTRLLWQRPLAASFQS